MTTESSATQRRTSSKIKLICSKPSHPSLPFCFLVRPLVCGGPQGEKVSLPAMAPRLRSSGRRERTSRESGPQSHLLSPRNLRRLHRREQLELRRGNPASHRHSSQVRQSDSDFISQPALFSHFYTVRLRKRGCSEANVEIRSLLLMKVFYF